MVAPTPKKTIFEGNFTSNTPPLFFEFAFEPSTVSFGNQTTLSTPLIHSKRKKVFHTASRLVLGLLITAFLLGSGLLNNELLTGKSGSQASLTWIPTWSADDTPTKPEKGSVVPLETPETSENLTKTDAKPESKEKTNVFSSTVASISNTAEITLGVNAEELDAIAETETVAEITETVVETEMVSSKESTDPEAISESPEIPSKPIIKPPVSPPSNYKLSTPVVNREEVAPKKWEITSEAFHAINKEASQDGKKVFIKFEARWCLPCKMMETNVFPDPEIRRMLHEDYLTLTVDVDKIDGVNLRQVFNVEAIPSFVILDNNQNLIGKYEGAKRIEELRSILGSVYP